MPISDRLLRVLRADNPWLDGEELGGWFGRHLPPRVIPRRPLPEGDGRVCLVVGPRQAGKSTLVWLTLERIGEPCLLLNCEEPSVREWLVSPATFLADCDELAPAVPALFFEEVQGLAEAGLFLKGVVDRRTGKRLYATGSSSFDLEARTRESLAGRAVRVLLLPLSLEEAAAAVEGPLRLAEHALTEEVRSRLLVGSYPPVVTSSEPRRTLAELVEAFVVRDVSDRFRIRRLAAFQKVLELAASQIGNLVNFSEWEALASVSNDTVAEYCRLLEETHVLRLVRPFVGGKRAEITSAPKVYFLDNGIRNQLFGGFSAAQDRADRGALFENLVYSELAKLTNPLLHSLCYWRSKSGAEVDFVVSHRGRLIAVEVKAGAVRHRLSRSLRSFVEAYSPERLVVVSQTSRPDEELGRTRVQFLRAWELHGVVRELLG
jgi:predicted AAA+ superfamily ATPase